MDEQGNIVSQEWAVTTPDAFRKRFEGQAPMNIAMEVGTHSRWTSELLRRCGHNVGVADARQLALITQSNAKIDKRDARTLAQLLRADASLLSPITHRDEPLQMDLTLIRMRANLVETRTRFVSSVRVVVRQQERVCPAATRSSFHNKSDPPIVIGGWRTVFLR